VNLLTGVDREIKLVVYREKIVDKEEAEKEPPKGEKVVNFSQPRIIWNKTVATTIPAETITFSPTAPIHTDEITVDVSHSSESVPPPPPASVSPKTPESPPPLPVAPAPVLTPQAPTSPSPSPYASAIPSSYKYPSQSPPPSQSSNQVASPSLSPRTLSSDWNSPPAAIQPPKFQYPGFNRPGSRTSGSERKEASVTKKDTSSINNVSPVSNSIPYSVNSVNINNNKPSDKETDPGHRTMAVERQTIQMPKPAAPSEPVANHVDDYIDSKYPLEDCVIVKAGGPLGLSIVGGSDHSSSPFGEDQPGIFVSKVNVNNIFTSSILYKSHLFGVFF
jgi:protein scribble